jgi:hypothetical protein
MRAEFSEAEAELAGMREQRSGGESVLVLVDLHLLAVASTTRQTSLRPPSTAWLGTAVTEKKSQVVRGRFRASLKKKNATCGVALPCANKNRAWCCGF